MAYTQLSNWTMPGRLRSAVVWMAIVTASIALASTSAARRMMGGAGPVTTVSAASYEAAAIAPESIVASFGTMLATTTVIATDADPNTPGIQLPTTLGGTTVEVNGRRAGLFFVSPTQVNYAIPAATEAGPASVVIRAGDGVTSTGTMQVKSVAPAIFTANSNGSGVPAATLLRIKADGAQQFEPLAQFDALLGRFITRPINPGPAGERVFLILFLSGLRRADDPNSDGNLNETVRLVAGGIEIVPAYAGRQGDFVGLDQVNAELPRELIGRGVLDVAVRAVGATTSNAVQVEMAAAVSGGRAPRAFDESVNTDEDAAKAITLRGDDVNSRPLRYVVTRLPKHGKLSGSLPNLTYTPEENYNGQDDFAFKVNNGIDESAAATVNLNIRPVNDAPVLTMPGRQTVDAGQALDVTISGMDVDKEQTLRCIATGLPDGATFTSLSGRSWR